MTDGWLIDKSAYVRLAASRDRDEWIDRVDRGLVHVAALTLLEVGYSARSADDLASMMYEPPLSLMPPVLCSQATENRALEVQEMLADRGNHRAVGPIDLAIAAAAEIHRLTLVHVDKDFELIATVTGQPIERLQF